MLSVNLDQTPTYYKLQALAKSPVDLRNLDSSRITKYQCEVADLKYIYGTQRIDDKTIETLQELAEETDAVAQFRRMIDGEVVNKIHGYESENRQVLHNATRNVFDDLEPLECKDCHIAVRASRTELDKLKEFLKELREGEVCNAKGETFTDMILVGIGGSDLGPRAIYLALKRFSKPGRRVHFISNVDSDDAATVLQGLDLSRTLVNVISKSGGTLETLTNEALVASEYEKQGLEINKHFVCVTGKKSPMDNPDKYLRSFYMFDYIGGRFSVTSMVGGVILSFALGYDNFVKFLRGARRMDLNALEPDATKNMSLLMALIGIWNRNFLDSECLAVLPYSQAMSRFVAHLEQCDMESNGKRINRSGEALDYETGPIVWGEPGTNGQHAFYQLIHQSTTIISCDFIAFRKSQYGFDLEVQETTSQEKLLSNVIAQSIGLAKGNASDNPNKHFPGNRPNSLIVAEQLTPEVMGEILALYENKIAFQGFIWNINSFDQEGVQLGKVLANEIIDFYKGTTPTEENVSWTYLKEAGLI